MIVLIRHAKTKGNLKKRYIGTTDEPILQGTRLEKQYPQAEIIISSPMRRCIETAQLIYPGKKIRVYKDLSETNFGKFENRSYEDLKDDQYYKRWIESNGKLPFPDGESADEFRERSINAYNAVLEDFPDKNIAFIVHGGTIMAVMSYVFGGGFYDYMTDNLSGFKFSAGEKNYKRI